MRKFAAGFGTALLCLILAAVALRVLAHSDPKTRSVSFLINEAERLFELIVGPKGNVSPTPDPPVVVRGGSLNFFANQETNGSGNWGGTSDVFSRVLLKSPQRIYLDGAQDDNVASTDVCSNQYSTSTKYACNEEITDGLANNWTLTLTSYPFAQAGTTTTYSIRLCTQLDSSGRCSTDPSGQASTTIYADGMGAKDENNNPSLKPVDIDRQSAHLHFKFPGCPRTDENDDSDSNAVKCDKIQKIDFQAGSTTSGIKLPAKQSFQCMDGACDIKISDK
jgi:hypothetical protein